MTIIAQFGENGKTNFQCRLGVYRNDFGYFTIRLAADGRKADNPIKISMGDEEAAAFIKQATALFEKPAAQESCD